MYGKIENKNLVIAPKVLTVGDFYVWNASAEQYAAQGWLPVVFTDAPYDAPADFEWDSGWSTEDDQIVQEWVLVPLDPDRDLDDAEVLNILLGGDE